MLRDPHWLVLLRVVCRYVVKHEDKDAVDKEVARQEASEKFWQTRDFNLLTCSFYDKAKVSASVCRLPHCQQADVLRALQQEDKFTAERTEELSKHADVDKQLTKLPPSAKLSEGVCYDIVTMKTRHPGQMAKRVQLDQKSLNSKIGNEVEQRIRDRGDTLRDRAVCVYTLAAAAHVCVWQPGLTPSCEWFVVVIAGGEVTGTHE